MNTVERENPYFPPNNGKIGKDNKSHNGIFNKKKITKLNRN